MAAGIPWRTSSFTDLLQALMLCYARTLDKEGEVQLLKLSITRRRSTFLDTELVNSKTSILKKVCSLEFTELA